MTAIGWAQIALVLAAVLAAALPLSSYIARVLAGERTFLSPRSHAGRARVLQTLRRRSGARAELVRLCDGHARLQRRRLPFALRAAAAAECAAAQSAGLRSGPGRSRLQHVDELHHQHQLAELQRRDDDESSHADARADGSQLRLRRDRPRHGLRAGARLRARGVADGRQFLGRSDARRRSTCCCRSRSSSRSRSSRSEAPQTLAGSVDATTLEGAKQIVSIGPVASQEAIKELGTNGGGFFNANAAHPFENPNAFSNMLEIWAMLVIPFASVFAFGRAVLDFRQGRAIAIAMGIVLVAGVARRLLGRSRAAIRC